MERTGCGPFDGGCLAFAMALQRIFGGDIFVIDGSIADNPPGAQHAVLQLPNGQFADFDGIADALTISRRFIANAFPLPGIFTLSELRPLLPGDLPDAPCDESVVFALCRAMGVREQVVSRPMQRMLC